MLILLNLVWPKQQFSEAENRSLAEFPTFSVPGLLEGDYMGGVNTYLNDHFVGRPVWVSAQSLSEYVTGKREVNGVFLGKNALLGNLPPENPDMSRENINGVNAFAEKYGLPTYVMLVPSSAAVQKEKLPALATSWDEGAYIAETNAAFSSKVTPVPVYDTLRDHQEEYIYYRTDHHWTGYGAYLADTLLAEAMGRPVRWQAEELPYPVSLDFMGTYHSKTGFPLVKKDKIVQYQAGEATGYEVFNGSETMHYDSIFFPEFLDKKDKYSYFLGQVQPVATITTASASGKRLLVFKDSYAHAVAPLWLEDYSEIRLVDLRYMNATDWEEALEISRYDEALFLYSADVFAHQQGPYKLQQ